VVVNASDGRIGVGAKIIHGAPGGLLLPGAGKTEWFKDHETGPEMVVVPAGSFVMGSGDDGSACASEDEFPQHEVTIASAFAVSRSAVTFEEWDAAVAAGGVSHMPSDEGWGRGRQPVIGISWNDAQAYVTWLSKLTGQRYRLLSEAEWEYAARAGTETPFWWGYETSRERGNFDASSETGNPDDNRQRTLPVDQFEPNPWGLYQVHGNVWEWVEDAWHADYSGAPDDGSAWLEADAAARVMRGGSWHYPPIDCRSAVRMRYPPGIRFSNFGLRVARELAL
jgi:formylglycine-generating enzyme required for sulfatase activity